MPAAHAAGDVLLGDAFLMGKKFGYKTERNLLGNRRFDTTFDSLTVKGNKYGKIVLQ